MALVVDVSEFVEDRCSVVGGDMAVLDATAVLAIVTGGDGVVVVVVLVAWVTDSVENGNDDAMVDRRVSVGATDGGAVVALPVTVALAVVVLVVAFRWGTAADVSPPIASTIDRSTAAVAVSKESQRSGPVEEPWTPPISTSRSASSNPVSLSHTLLCPVTFSPAASQRSDVPKRWPSPESSLYKSKSHCSRRQ